MPIDGFQHFNMGRGRRVVGSIRDVSAGNPSSLPVRNANSGIPLKVSIYRIYIAPLQGNYSEALPAQALAKRKVIRRL